MGSWNVYRPPPAQAQAQPAQAQAQAQLPPLLRPPLLVATGAGFVLLVTRLVKSVTLPTTSLAKPCIPVTIEAANSPPGRLGMEGAERPLPLLGTLPVDTGREMVLRLQVGS